MDSFLKSVFVRAGKHTSVQDVHPHIIVSVNNTPVLLWGGGVGVLINNQINVKSQMLGFNPEITSFESMEVVITVGSITIRLSVIYRMPLVKS